MKNDYPIDFVVMWVDGNDPNWQQKKSAYVNPSTNKLSNDVRRYRDWDILHFWFRGVEKFAPWVNKVFLITDEQVPNFLNKNHPKLVLVDHKDYIPEQYLPTFNSNSIEVNIHRIKGLSEHFVLFNDDMFFINHVIPDDFFENGIPRSNAILNAITGVGDEIIQNIILNDVSIINKHFSKNTVISNAKPKWFNASYGLSIFRTLLLMPWSNFTGFVEEHLANSYLKSTFHTVWDKEQELLSNVSNRKIRDARDVNQWLFRYWQIASNNFIPRSLSFGNHYDVDSINFKECCEYIMKQKGKIVCVNDSVREDFDNIKKAIQGSFETILPAKSMFEN